MEDCRNPDLNTISHDTMAQLISNSTLPFTVIDCRFDYEFEGGHIKGALNLNSPIKVEEYFFKLKDQIQTMMQQRAIVVFHCEFSQHRGPKMYRTLREIDRTLHMHHYPQIFYPEVYLLEGGFKEFHTNHPELCDGAYLPMADKEFKQDCKIKFSKTRQLFR
jgi:rhodanese-related sulfurtransferase